jgi:hypothetical protein
MVTHVSSGLMSQGSRGFSARRETRQALDIFSRRSCRLRSIPLPCFSAGAAWVQR